MVTEILYSCLLTKKFTFENYRLIGRILLLDKNYNQKILEKIKKRYFFEKKVISIQLYTLKRNIQIEWLNSGIIRLKNPNGNYIYTDWNGKNISFNIITGVKKWTFITKIKKWTFITKIKKWNFILKDSKEARKRFFQMIYNYIMIYSYEIAFCFNNTDIYKFYSKNKAMKNINYDTKCDNLLIY